MKVPKYLRKRMDEATEKYKLNLRPNRKYIYVLSYEYSTKLKNGEYQDYYYIRPSFFYFSLTQNL